MCNSKISVIIPVYNPGKHLLRCLDSVVGQSYSNLEIILVDDGSTDESPWVCDKYAEKDERVRVIHKKNQGLSFARNAGIALSCGEYLMFVDSDDWIDSNTCSIVYQAAHKYAADVVMWSYVRAYSHEYRKKKIFDTEFIIFNECEVTTKLHRRMVGLLDKELSEPENADALSTVWAKLYKTSIIKDNSIKFVDTKFIGTSEDALFNLYCFGNIKKVVYINRHLYYYNKENNDSVTVKYKAKLCEQWDFLFALMEDYIDKNMPQASYREALNNRIALSIIGLGLNALLSSKNIRGQYLEINDIISRPRFKNAVKQLKTEFMPINWKVFFYCARLNFSVFVFALLVIIFKLKSKT